MAAPIGKQVLGLSRQDIGSPALLVVWGVGVGRKIEQVILTVGKGTGQTSLKEREVGHVRVPGQAIQNGAERGQGKERWAQRREHGRIMGSLETSGHTWSLVY